MGEQLYDAFCNLDQGQPHRLIKDIMKDPLFLRLHKISQLNLKSSTTSNMKVTRGDHCNGVRIMASLYTSILNKNSAPSERISEVESLAIQVAGLLHDVGHGPFSHLFEQALSAIGIKWCHEDQSVRIIHDIVDPYLIPHENKIVNQYDLPPDFANVVCDMVKGITKEEHSLKYANSVFKRYVIFTIVNGDHESCLDIDKYDYMRRDSFSICNKEYYELVSKAVEDIMLNSKIENDRIVYSVRAAESLVLFGHLIYNNYRYIHYNPADLGLEILFSDILKEADLNIEEHLTDLSKFVMFDDIEFMKMCRAASQKENGLALKKLFERFDRGVGYEMIGNVDIQDRDDLNPENLLREVEEKLIPLMDDIGSEDYVFTVKILNRIVKKKTGKWNILESVHFYDKMNSDKNCSNVDNSSSVVCKSIIEEDFFNHENYLQKYRKNIKLSPNPEKHVNEAYSRYDNDELPFQGRTIQIRLYSKTTDKNKIKKMKEAFQQFI